MVTYTFLTLDLLLIAVVITLTYGGALDDGFAAVIVTVGVAVGGWLVNARQSQINLRIQHKQAQANLKKQHSLDVLLQSRFSDIHDRHRSRVYEKVLADDQVLENGKIKADYIMDPKNVNFRMSVMFLANYFEFLAAACLRGYLDEPVMRDVLRGRLCGYYKRIESYVKLARRETAQGVATKPQVFENFVELHRRWSAPEGFREEDALPLPEGDE